MNIQPGSSGAPILNDQQEVLGIHKGFDQDWNLNYGTATESLRGFLEDDRQAELDRMLRLWQQKKDSRIKFDLAEILLEAGAKPDLMSALSVKVCQSHPEKNLLFYLQNIRKIIINCPSEQTM